MTVDFQRIITFLRQDIWRIRLRDLPRTKSFFIKQLRITLLAAHGLTEDRLSLRASALTFYSLLSVVPTAAMAFGIAQGFGMKELLETWLLEEFKGHEEVIDMIISFAYSMLENTRGGLIAGIGVVSLIWFVVRLLGNIEKSLNEVWGITHSRSFMRKMSDYLALMFVCPILLVSASSSTIYITTQLTRITQKVELLGSLSPLILLFIKLLPFFVIWMLFTFVYIFMPNTKVRFKSALLGGIIAGTLFMMVEWAYITFQIGVSRYGAIYGSFAALPLFLAWLQISWLIVLFGAEASFAHQNVDTYELEPDSEQASHAVKQLIALQITHGCVKTFRDGGIPLNAEQISNRLELPIRLVNRILFVLVKSHILTKTIDPELNEPGYQPARDIDTLRIQDVIQAMERAGNNDIPFITTKEITTISGCIQSFHDLLEHSDANLLLKDI